MEDRQHELVGSSRSRSMDLTDVFSRLPFVELLGIEVTHAEDGVAEARLPMTDVISSNPGRQIAHGGATFALADTVGGAAVMSLVLIPTPTVDMRIDYLEPVTDDIVARGEVVRRGNTTAVVDVSVKEATDRDSDAEEGDEGREVARARGVYKLGVDEGSPHDWRGSGGEDRQ